VNYKGGIISLCSNEEGEIAFAQRPLGHPPYWSTSVVISLGAICFTLFFPLLAISELFSARREDQHLPLSRVDLRQFGFSEAKPWKKSPFRLGDIDHEYHEITFGANDTLFAAVSYAGNPEAQHRKRLSLVIMDATSGQILSTHVWEAVYYKLGLLATPTGNIIVRVENELAVYSSKLELLKKMPLQITRNPGDEYWKVLLSPSGESIVLVHRVNELLEFSVLEPDTFRQKRSWKIPADVFSTIGSSFVPLDDGILSTVKDRANGDCLVNVNNPDGSSASVYRIPPSCHLEVQALDNDTFYIRTGNEFILIKRGGGVLLRQPMRKGEFPAAMRTSADGRRIAIAYASMKGGSEFLDLSSHQILKRVQIYDVATLGSLFVLDEKSVNLQSVSDFGLSPDGSRLAILRDGFIEVYATP
jgi:hypothetical protein